MIPMRLLFSAAFCGVLLLAAAGCDEFRAKSLAHPNVVIVREFAAPLGVVTLDPSFGFSLNRGEPGVPPRQRAAAVARAAAFALADSIADRLRAQGFDVVRSNTEQPEPGARALIVTGAFRKINEGYRRRVGEEGSAVEAAAQVEYRAPGSQPQILLSQQFDSAHVHGEAGITPAAARGGSEIQANARLAGAEIARRIAELARSNN